MKQNTRTIKILFLISIMNLIILPSNAQLSSPVPRLVKNGNITQLLVNNKPYLIFGGELGNSSASSNEYMRPIWPKLKQMNLNTVIAPVYWELMEPIEGRFDFILVDSLIKNARQNKMKLVLLWFGSWKNSMSCRRMNGDQDHQGRHVRIPYGNYSSQHIKLYFY